MFKILNTVDGGDHGVECTKIPGSDVSCCDSLGAQHTSQVSSEGVEHGQSAVDIATLLVAVAHVLDVTLELRRRINMRNFVRA